MNIYLIYVFVVFDLVALLSAQPGGQIRHCCQNDLCSADCVRCDGTPTCYDLSDELGCNNDADKKLLSYEKPPVFVPFILNILRSRLRQEKMELYSKNPNHACFTSHETTTEEPVWLQLIRKLQGNLNANQPTTTTMASTTQMPIWKMLLYKLQGQTIPPQYSVTTTSDTAKIAYTSSTSAAVPGASTESFVGENTTAATPTTTGMDLSSTVDATPNTKSNTSVISPTPAPDKTTSATTLPSTDQNATTDASNTTTSNSSVTSQTIKSDEMSTVTTTRASKVTAMSSSPSVTDSTIEGHTTYESTTLLVPNTTKQLAMGIPVTISSNESHFSTKQENVTTLMTKPTSVSKVTAVTPSDSSNETTDVNHSVSNMTDVNATENGLFTPINETLIDSMITEINSSISINLPIESTTDSLNVTTPLQSRTQRNESLQGAIEQYVNNTGLLESNIMAKENITENENSTPRTPAENPLVNDTSTSKNASPTSTSLPVKTGTDIVDLGSHMKENESSEISAKNLTSLNTSESRDSLVYIARLTTVNSTNMSVDNVNFGNVTDNNSIYKSNAENITVSQYIKNTVIETHGQQEDKGTLQNESNNITINETNRQQNDNGTHQNAFLDEKHDTRVPHDNSLRNSKTVSVDIALNLNNATISEYSVDEKLPGVNNRDNENVYNTSNSGDSVTVSIVSNGVNIETGGNALKNKVAFEKTHLSQENEIRIMLGKLHSLIDQDKKNFSSQHLLREFNIQSENNLDRGITVRSVSLTPPSTVPTATEIIVSTEKRKNLTAAPAEWQITTVPPFTLNSLFGFTFAPPFEQGPYRSSQNPLSWDALFGNIGGVPITQPNQKAPVYPQHTVEKLNDIYDPFTNNDQTPPTITKPLNKETVQNMSPTSYVQNGYKELSKYVTTPQPKAIPQTTFSTMNKYLTTNEDKQMTMFNSATTPKPSTQLPLYHNNANLNLNTWDLPNRVQAQATTEKPMKDVNNNNVVKSNTNAGLSVESIASWWQQVYTTLPPDSFTAPTTTYSPFAEVEQCYEIQDITGFCQTRSGHFSNPTDCRTFYVCMWGYLHRCSCPPNTMFDSKVQVCNWDSLVTCAK